MHLPLFMSADWKTFPHINFWFQKHQILFFLCYSHFSVPGIKGRVHMQYNFGPCNVKSEHPPGQQKEVFLDIISAEATVNHLNKTYRNASTTHLLLARSPECLLPLRYHLMWEEAWWMEVWVEKESSLNNFS